MNIVDSSGWLAYFADEPNAGRFWLARLGLLQGKPKASLLRLLSRDISRVWRS